MAKKHQQVCNSVLLIDDNEIDNFINERMIKACSFSQVIHIFRSGNSALDFLKDAKDEIPEVVFLDINMPIMDGFQFLVELEKLPKSISQSVKVVILTSSVNPSDEETAKKYKQVVKFAHKPLNDAQLKDLSEIISGA